MTREEKTAVDVVRRRLEGEPLIPKHVVLTASAARRGPRDRERRYRIAVIQTNRLDMPKQINPRHMAVVRIVKLWEGVSQRKGVYRSVVLEATELAKALNGGAP